MRTGKWVPVCGAVALVLLSFAPAVGEEPAVQPGCSVDPATLPAGGDPKNVILMIGDGMGPEQVELGRLFAGRLAMEELDEGTLGLATTDEYYGKTTDSAANASSVGEVGRS